MIIRKPYAFLIKHFKLLHVLMFLLFGYLLFSLRDIYMFFKDAVLSNSIYGGGLEDKYVSFLFILIILVLLGLTAAIYVLMKRKSKPVLFYKIIMIYTGLLFLEFILCRSYFSNVGSGVEYSTNTLVLYRDISLILYIVTYGFVGFTFARAFGFDIKKFGFDKDKKELNISSEDSGEVELNINLDKEKIVNQIRKEKRQVMYYIKDNQVILKKIGIAASVLLFIYILVVIFIFNRTYGMNSWIDLENYASSFMVEKVYLTNRDAYQDVRNKNTNYVGVVFRIRVGNYNIALDNRFLRLKLNGEYYYATHKSTSILSDMGTLYNGGDKLEANKELKYMFVYAYDSSIKAKNISLEILLNGKYHRIRTDYMEQFNEDKGYQELTFKENEKLPILDGFTIKSHKFIGGTAEYKYQDPACKNSDDCRMLTKRVQPRINEKLLELDVDYKESKENIDKLEYYVSIEYEYNGKKYLNSARNLTIVDYVTLEEEQRIYLSVNTNVPKSTKKYLVITTRDARYRLLLTEENE